MKIFIFKPSEHWDYCGGGKVCIAETFDSAAALFKKTDEDAKFFEHDFSKQPVEDYDNWVLVETFPTTETRERVILDDYNWE